MLFLFEDDTRFEIPPGAWQEMERGRGEEALPQPDV
jgi:hypothetical protein